MAALLEKVRNFHQHPAMSEEERAAEFGTYPPKKRRASLNAAQRNTAVPKQSGPLDYDDSQVPTRTTDDLEREPHTSKHPTPMRDSGNSGYNNYEPRRRSFWTTVFTVLCVLAGIATLLYSIVFLIVAGWTLLTNTLSYGPTHTAYTQATINGQATTIQTSNVNGTILITLINNKDGSARTYSYTDLNANAWNNDLSGIVATASVEHGTITVHLTGSMNYFHLFFTRPQMKLQLLPDKQAGYKVVVVS